MPSLVLPLGARAAVDAWVEDGFPREACGLLIGRETVRGAEVAYAARARNLAPDWRNDRYVLAPEDFARIEQGARGRGMAIVGVWHSHPGRPARPSGADLETAWKGCSYLIAAVDRNGIGDVRSWRLDGAKFVEQPVVEQPVIEHPVIER